jgi:hypothetical protein
LSALRRFWDAVGELPRLPHLSLEEHGVIAEAVVSLQTYLGAVNLLDARTTSNSKRGFEPIVSAAKQSLSVPLHDICLSTPSSRNNSIGDSGSSASDHSPKRRSLFSSITKRRF